MKFKLGGEGIEGVIGMEQLEGDRNVGLKS